MVLLKGRYAEFKKGTSAVLLQSSLDEKLCAVSMECYSYLRNIQDLFPDEKTPYGRQFGEPFKGPVLLFDSLVEYHRNQARQNQFGEKVLLGMFFGYAL